MSYFVTSKKPINDMKTMTLRNNRNRTTTAKSGRSAAAAANGGLANAVTSPLHSLLRLKSILVPVDFSGPSKSALEYALPLLQKFGAKLTLLHVVEPMPLPAFATPFPPPMESDKAIEACSIQLKLLIK